MANWCVNEAPKWIALFIWIGLNVLVFTLDYIKFDTRDKYVYIKFLTKQGLPVARGSAEMLNLNCLLILLPVCRNLLSFIRDFKYTPHFLGRLLDKNITFHKLCAYMICFATALHLGAHIFNVENLVFSWSQKDHLSLKLNGFQDRDTPQGNTTRLNFVGHPDAEPLTEILKTLAGITGVIITLALILMVTSATELVRRSYFEVFWFTHHLFVVFFIGVFIHGAGRLIRSQNNVKQHDPNVCKDIADWSKPPCNVDPQFSNPGPQSWKWIIAPVALYLFERIVRLVRSCQKVELKKVIKHPSRVIELQMRKSGWKACAGQYIFVQCSNLSNLEWHPFTLTSCPEEDFFSVHIRIVGDWTEGLSKLCDKHKADQAESTPDIRLSVDGPFGTASTDVFQYQAVMCVGAGIGVTPFASILKSIWYQHHKANPDLRVRKVYFFWVCPDTNAFEWFADMLQLLEDQMAQKGLDNFLEYNIYLTRGWDKGVARNIVMHDADDQDVITGLKQKTNYGRPNWDLIFKGIGDSHPNTDIGVFFCGPAVLSHTLHAMSNKHSDADKAVRFFYNKENF